MHCARGHYLQLPALLNSSLHFILICKFIIYCKVMKRYAAMEIDSSRQFSKARTQELCSAQFLPLTGIVILKKAINVAQFWKINWTSWWKIESVLLDDSLRKTFQTRKNPRKSLLKLGGCLGGSLEASREASCWSVCKAWGQEKEGKAGWSPLLCAISLGMLS